MKRICIGSLIFIATCLLQADPPRFLAPNPQKEQEKTVEELLPIPPQATEEQKALYEAAIEGARQQDVSVTP
ncbi:MAG: hypothetical protein IJS15_15660 [Victivallales bacterium]|nr:hypothetical protein [Victivallales bacterium]